MEDLAKEIQFIRNYLMRLTKLMGEMNEKLENTNKHVTKTAKKSRRGIRWTRWDEIPSVPEYRMKTQEEAARQAQYWQQQILLDAMKYIRGAEKEDDNGSDRDS